MATRTITTARPYVTCDVCGRGLLRGEMSDVFVDSGQRRVVCELCLPRATAEGWTREGGEDSSARARSPRRRRPSLISRLLGGRRAAPEGRGHAAAEDDEPATPEVRVSPRRARTVHAVPTSIDSQMARAIEIFNRGLEPRRVSGVARALGEPQVTVRPAQPAGTVRIVVAWELCWYRFEVGLADGTPEARLIAEGLELSELDPEDLTCNAAADERGELRLATAS